MYAGFIIFSNFLIWILIGFQSFFFTNMNTQGSKFFSFNRFSSIPHILVCSIIIAV